jgi:hypothetical protein
MYISPQWDTLFPYVEIVRQLDRSTILYKNGKNQTRIRDHAGYYNHTTFGEDFKTKEDYLRWIVRGRVKFVFVFTDSQDPFSVNIIEFAKKQNIPLICYSNIDSKYHFYDHSNCVEKITDPLDVINKMKELNDILTFEKMVDMFPEFELIPDEPVENKNLQRCIEKIKKCALAEENYKKSHRTKIYKPIEKKPIVVKKTIETPLQKTKASITSFFKSKV